MSLALTGHGVAPGVAIGRAHLAERNEIEIGEYRIREQDVEAEIQRYRNAIEAAEHQLGELAERMDSVLAVPASEIIQTHILMLRDSTIRHNTEDHIRTRLCNAEWALQSQLEAILGEFRNVDDEYIRTRAEDVAQVVRLIQGQLNRESAGRSLENFPDRLADTLVVAEELTPGELAILQERGVAGIVTEHGGPNSHTAILANSLGIPAVLGVNRAQGLLREGETLVLDGSMGLVFAEPTADIQDHYRHVQRDTERFRQSLEAVRDLPSRCLDGEPVTLRANAERAEELRQALGCGAEGIGLYRTEFLYLRSHPPDEDTQLAEYRSAISMLRGAPLTIRTLDLGADKTIASIEYSVARRATNPALGLRAIRLCLRDTELFKVQLRAILRASADGPVRCLIPMVTSLHEVRMVRTLFDEAREELERRGQRYDPQVPLGGMIEVPAAALAIADMGGFLDFLSVGTNDLLQYALAADRGDEQVAHLYELEHPGVVRLLRQLLRSANRLSLPVAVCGEAAGDRRYTRLLLALGVRELSMHPGRLLEIKKMVRETDAGKARVALKYWLDYPAERGGLSLLQALDESQRTH
jgi:phosphotransferase system enzyme I (PtsI)